jgi:pyruvate,orthophosphate dikinase
MAKYVYDLIEGHKELKDLLGGKGANLAEMTRLGLPVPPGFHDHDRGVPDLSAHR